MQARARVSLSTIWKREALDSGVYRGISMPICPQPQNHRYRDESHIARRNMIEITVIKQYRGQALSSVSQ